MQSARTSVTAAAVASNISTTLDVRNHDVVAFSLKGNSSPVLTVNFEATLDGTNWYSLAAISLASTTVTTAVISVANPTATSGIYVVEPDRCAALQQVRARVSGFTSGSVDIYIVAGTTAQGAQ